MEDHLLCVSPLHKLDGVINEINHRLTCGEKVYTTPEGTEFKFMCNRSSHCHEKSTPPLE